jgi:predicted anti-sigma-YlaC factor YlaD
MDLVRPLACERARQWASQRVDTDLSELEAARLERHISGCATCATFVTQLASVVGALRSAPIAHLSEPVFFPVARRSRHHVMRFAALGTTIAAVCAAVAVGLLTDGPAPADRSYSDIGLPADNGRSELDSVRLAAARASTAPPAPWPGHGPATS